MPRWERANWGSAVTSPPSKDTRPEVGGSSPAMSLKNVLLPAPLGPITDRSSPARTSKSTALTARSLPKLRVSFSVRSRMDDVSGSLLVENGSHPK